MHWERAYQEWGMAELGAPRCSSFISQMQGGDVWKKWEPAFRVQCSSVAPFCPRFPHTDVQGLTIRKHSWATSGTGKDKAAESAAGQWGPTWRTLKAELTWSWGRQGDCLESDLLDKYEDLQTKHSWGMSTYTSLSLPWDIQVPQFTFASLARASGSTGV
jgi:hypothetical protein